MEKSYSEQAQRPSRARAARRGVLVIGPASISMLLLGLWLASLAGGVPPLWAGSGFALAAWLAIVVGLSKTSSA